MNLTTKKLIFILTALLSGMAFMASCSKTEEPSAKGGKKAKKSSVAVKDKKLPVSEKHTFTAVRNGQNVTINWHLDESGDKITQIQILRSATGKKSQLARVARLKPEDTTFKDSLPSESPYWYWLHLFTQGGKFQDIGPVKVEADAAGASAYVKPVDNYKISIIRTDDMATIKWDFPENEYKSIRIVRAKRPIKEPFSHGTDVIASKVGKSQCTNGLPDANSEYWYWFRIFLPSGLIVDRGPIKAEYAKRQTK